MGYNNMRGCVLVPLALLCLVTCGCQEDEATYSFQQEVFPQRGRVSISGKPAVGARITLHPQEGGIAGAELPHATVEADGTFWLSTYKTNDGAPAGKYVATITWPGPADEFGDEGPDQLKGRYSNPEKSKLPIVVSSDSTEIPPIELRGI